MPSTLPVFSVDDLPAGQFARLDGPEGKHAATVRRMRSGAQLMLSDGRGGLAECRVTDVVRDALDLEVLRRDRVPASEPRVRLVQALVKGDRGELAVELATEAGVDVVTPWRAERCVARWEEGPRGAKALARWRNSALQAAKQARRAWTPTVTEPCSTSGLAEVLAGADAAFVLHESADAGLADVELPSAGEIAVVVGPEGGVTEGELSSLASMGARPVRLGHEVLRASTAGAVLLGALGVLTPRWR
ncbi:16S rRNA (uracil(1498)-N(3))-methyltransferase [Actinopolyspora erythraea]|uniref:Ribosomal RNA small subunit methyltransferase E n=1 Tax=Actinopolyspora erythraea TaxID=414996 RepID=A0A099D1N1_9ACTN|nr:16S rRNA (uracil(1498)-N(3))-methyltransferase [Actinopolyspora erythraea]ASU77964.1 16S rRNA (uracil(1498)-N(3))-methyltransferase [Actinopolyspora erythraea]KGI79727.1 16S rRNA methyltransferase [Actinopolyspora erythraea]